MEDAPNGAETSRQGAKRKRKASGHEGGSNGRTSDIASEDQVEVEVEREGSPDDFEEFRPRSKRNRASETTTPAPQNSNQSLIDIIKGNRKQIPQLVRIWVERYKKDPKPAMVELLTMLFEACGAKYFINEEVLDETDVDDVVAALVNLAIKGEVEDYQTSKMRDLRNFRNNLVFFWDKLVVECQNGPLFDKVLFDKCMDYIIELSGTPPRVYRQFATVMGLQIATSFITVAKALGTQREKTQRELNAEKKKRAEGPRLESLNKRLSMTHDQILVLEDMMRKILTKLFVHRYRDKDSTIRISCITSLGVWMLSYPSLFLEDSNLKYFGWALNDNHAGVRKASFVALEKLHDVDDTVPTLSLFTERFSKRMIELAKDIDVSVAVSAIALVKQLLRHQLIGDDDLCPLYEILVDDSAEIRHAMGELVYVHLITKKNSTTQSSSEGKDNESKVHLSRMLQILRDFSADPIVSAYAIDGIWDYMKAMKDWKCIVSMLLDENTLIEFTDNDATNLVRLLCASARKAVGERIVPASDNRKRRYSKAQKEIFVNNRRRLTIAMMKNLPLILRKFLADKTKVPSLVVVTLYMNIELYSLKRQDQNFQSVLELIKEAFFKHGDQELLSSCVKAINFFSIESQGELKDYALDVLKNLENELISKLQTAMKAASDGDDFLVLVNLKRLYELQLSRAVPIDNLHEDIVKTLYFFRSVNYEVVSLLLLNMYSHVAWSLQSILNSETVSEASVSSLMLKRNTLFEELGYFLGTPSEADQGTSYGNELSRRVCVILAEAWCLFRKMNFSSTKLESLGYCPDTSDLQRFWKLCEQQLKISDEDNGREYIEVTHRRAVLAAAAKLVATDTASKEYLHPEIIPHFVMHGTEITEIVKDDDDVSIICLEVLKRAYQQHLIDLSIIDDESITSKSFQECKDLAARLSRTFAGDARSKYSKEISKLVEDGIEYAFLDAPKQLSFLEGVVSHFISKLPTPKVVEILQDVVGRTENVDTDDDPSGWCPYHRFVKSLKKIYAKNEALAGAKRNHASETTTPAPQNSNQSLIDIIKGNGKQIPLLVRIWVERYKKDPKPAMVELLTMLFEACGAKYCINEEVLDETDVDDVVAALVNLAIKGEVEDYQTSKMRDLRNFRDNLVFFWDKLVVECQNGPLFDKVLFDKCMDYIIKLSRTPPRVYRQFATVMGLQIATSFITVAKALGTQREKTQRELNAEKKKGAEGPLLESLNKRLSMTHDQILVLEDMMRKILTELFVHRYRDKDSTIRISCITSLGVWILSYPSLFLQEPNLEYFWWRLNDTHAGVRKASVAALEKLYDVDDNVPTLSLFTERFSKRMIELAKDIDVSVAVSAIALVKQLLRHQLIGDDDLFPLYKILVDHSAEIRHAMGELVYDHLITKKNSTTQSSSEGKDNESEVHLRRMLQILRDFSADPLVSVYAIDGIWDYMKAMKDWKCIVSMLLDENTLIEFTDNDATNLVRLLFASARKAVGERIVPASDNRKRHYSKAQKEIFVNNRQQLTIAMMENLPLLLRKFMADKTKVPSLVEVTLYMNIELYSLMRQDQNFQSVLELIKEAFFKHGDQKPLSSCVKAINFFSIESKGKLKDYALNVLKNLEEELISKLQTAMKAASDGDDSSLLVNLKTLHELQLSRAVPIDNLHGVIVHTLHIFRSVNYEVVSLLLLNMYSHVAWSLQSILNSETVSEASVSSLILKRNTLFEELGYFLGTSSEAEQGISYGNELSRGVCIILAKAWRLFRKMKFSSTKLESLGYCPDTSDLQRFWKLCEQQLKISDEAEDEDNDREYTEVTNRNAVITAAANLVATDTVYKAYLSPEIISHFVMRGTRITEIVKDDDDVSIICLEVLKRAYQQHLIDLSISADESITSKSFQECKDLAARLSGTFAGAARSKYCKEISKLVEDGIEYAFLDAPKQLSFLEGVVSHFISKLPTPKVVEILQDVEGRTENVDTDDDPSGWRPYHRFVKSLKKKYAKNEPLAEDTEVNVRRRGPCKEETQLREEETALTRSSSKSRSVRAPAKRGASVSRTSGGSN